MISGWFIDEAEKGRGDKKTEGNSAPPTYVSYNK